MTFARQFCMVFLGIFVAISVSVTVTFLLAYYWLTDDFLKMCSAVTFFVASCGFSWIARGHIDRVYSSSRGVWRRDNVWATVCGFLYVLCLFITLVSLYMDFITPNY